MAKGDPGLFVQYCAKDFLDGTQMLGPWEELAYRRICDMIYVTNDRLPDDDRKMAWATKVGKRWPAIKAALTSGDHPKLTVVDGRVTNARCQDALGTAAQNMMQQSIAGKASSATGKSLKNLKQNRTAFGISSDENTEQPPNGAPNGAPNQPLTTMLPSEAPPKETPLKGGKERVPSAKRRMVPEDWAPSEVGRAHAQERARWSGTRIDSEAAAFRDHHRAKGNLFADIDAAWRTWVQNGAKFDEHRDQTRRQPNGRSTSEHLPHGGYAYAHESPDHWRDRLRGWRDRGSTRRAWVDEAWGPAPGEYGCRVPAEVLAEFTEPRAAE